MRRLRCAWLNRGAYRPSWRETALDRPTGRLTRHLLAEDDWGDLLVPSRTRSDWWDRRYNPKNPMHWRFWLLSRLSRKIVMVEAP